MDAVCYHKWGTKRGFSKTSVFGKAALDLWGKADFWPLFQEHFTKLTEFWEMLKLQIFFNLHTLITILW
jgi:hypothetical protein